MGAFGRPKASARGCKEVTSRLETENSLLMQYRVTFHDERKRSGEKNGRFVCLLPRGKFVAIIDGNLVGSKWWIVPEFTPVERWEPKTTLNFQ